MYKIISRSQNCDTTNSHRSAVENMRKSDDFSKFCDATPSVFIASQIGDQGGLIYAQLCIFFVYITFWYDKYSNS